MCITEHSEELDDKELLQGLSKNPRNKMFIVVISLIYMLIFLIYILSIGFYELY